MVVRGLIPMRRISETRRFIIIYKRLCTALLSGSGPFLVIEYGYTGMVCPYGMFTVISVSPNRNAAFLNKKQTNPSRYGSDLSIVSLPNALDFYKTCAIRHKNPPTDVTIGGSAAGRSPLAPVTGLEPTASTTPTVISTSDLAGLHRFMR